jgi:hypothetical protein
LASGNQGEGLDLEESGPGEGDGQKSGQDSEEDVGGKGEIAPIYVEVWTSLRNAGRPGGKMQLWSGHSCCVAGECITEIVFLY